MNGRHDIKILIMGTAGSGKSIIAGIIANALRENNITIKAEVLQDGNTSDHLIDRLQRFEKQFPPIQVTLEEKSVTRPNLFTSNGNDILMETGNKRKY